LTYISTASLDGEKNLKLRTVPKILLESFSPTDFSQIDAECHSQKPDTSLYDYTGTLTIAGKPKQSLDIN
jgi:magnesium-transporting ATPase (P-type)